MSGFVCPPRDLVFYGNPNPQPAQGGSSISRKDVRGLDRQSANVGSEEDSVNVEGSTNSLEDTATSCMLLCNDGDSSFSQT
jgi:hypothetical protein